MKKLSDVENVKGSVLLDGNDVEVIKLLIYDWCNSYDETPRSHEDDISNLCKKLGIPNPL